MTKEMNKLIDRIKTENIQHRIKIVARKARNFSDTGLYHLYLQRHLSNGKKESRSLQLAIIGNSKSMVSNLNNYELAKTLRRKLEVELFEDSTTGKILSINKKVETKDYLDYFEKNVKRSLVKEITEFAKILF